MGYFGSKAASGAYQAIIAAMPPHNEYFELFLGGGAILERKPPALLSYALDLDRDALFKYARAHDYKIKNEAECIASTSGCYLLNISALDILTRCVFTPNTFIYADPPYVLSTRTSAKRYKYDFTLTDHENLLNALLKLELPKIMVSGYPSDLYNDVLRDWHTIEFQVMTRGGPRTEKLWMNYEPSDLAYSAAYSGYNFTDRQRIKRKAQRWACNYDKLDAQEKLAIFAELLKTHSHP